jgi:L-ascorbate metabolism protein UlaG (beta-lactamase superfamily)
MRARPSLPTVDSIPGLRWLGHSTLLVPGPPAIYVDPWRLAGRKGLPPAALVLVTHAHFDHASPEDVAAVAGEGTLLAGPAGALARLPGARKRTVREGDSFEEAGARIRVLAAADREEGFHPPGAGVGYLVETAAIRVLHAGDTARETPRVEPPPDVFAVPVSGGTVFDAEGAAAAAAASGAAHALPIHWGDVIGKYEDAARFRDALARLSPAMRTILREAAERKR